MRKFLLYFLCCFTLFGYAQNGINYKGIIKDNDVLGALIQPFQKV